MGLQFQNQYHGKLYIALVYGDASCGSKFRKQGWWSLDPFQTRTLWDVNLQTVNRFASFYAEEFKDGGGATCNGTGNQWYQIPGVGFSQCYEDNSNCSQQPNFVALDFQQADNGHHLFNDLRITLGPAAGQLTRMGSVIID